MHAESDGRTIIHVVLCRHLQRQAPSLPGGPKGPKHIPHSQLSICLAKSMFRGSHATFQVGQVLPSPTCPAALGLAESYPHVLAPRPT